MVAQSSTRSLQALLLMAAVGVATPAFGQQAPEPQSARAESEEEGEKSTEGAVPSANLAIHGISDGLEVRVLSKEEGRAVDGDGVASCTQDCELKLPAGPYRLVTSQGTHYTTKDVDLDTRLSLTVSEPSSGLHGVGVGLGITGIAVAALGSLVAVSALVAPADSADSGARKTVLYSGLLGVAAGSGLMVGGFSLAAENRAPSLELDHTPRLERLQRPAATGISFAKTF